MTLQEIRRFQYPPSIRDGHLRWNFSYIFEEIKTGLREAGEQARASGRHVESIGVDSWGVDYGLIDDDGEIVEDPVCYRDERTSGEMERVFEQIPREKIFARTGIQFLNFNTLFQLNAQMREGLPARAAKLLMIPDLINFLLTGRAVTEYTNATTTQLVNAETRAWDAWHNRASWSSGSSVVRNRTSGNRPRTDQASTCARFEPRWRSCHRVGNTRHGKRGGWYAAEGRLGIYFIRHLVARWCRVTSDID